TGARAGLAQPRGHRDLALVADEQLREPDADVLLVAGHLDRARVAALATLDLQPQRALARRADGDREVEARLRVTVDLERERRPWSADGGAGILVAARQVRALGGRREVRVAEPQVRDDEPHGALLAHRERRERAVLVARLVAPGAEEVERVLLRARG